VFGRRNNRWRAGMRRSLQRGGRWWEAWRWFDVESEMESEIDVIVRYMSRNGVMEREALAKENMSILANLKLWAVLAEKKPEE
jgi:hypothetical protein